MRVSLRVLVLVAAVSAIVVTAASAQPTVGAAQDPMAGARVFATKGCEKCHAVNGVGGKVGPDLARVARPQSFFDLATAM
jgi:cytochrome c2